MKRELNADQVAARDAKRTKFRQLAKQLSAMPRADREALAARLPVISTIEGRTVSAINMCLVAAQIPSATIVGGFKQWRKAGRVVRKGEHGASIWVPFKSKADDNAENSDVHFGMGTVFDVAQTEEIGAVTATASPEVAAFIDPAGTLQNAGLLKVAA